MAQILNSQISSQAIASSSTNSLEVALNKLQGQLAQLQTSPNGNAILALNGNSITLPKLFNVSQQTQTVQLKIKEQSTQTLLDIIKPGKSAHSLQLTPTQSQQLLNAVGNSPELLSALSMPLVDAKVKQVSGNQVTLQVGTKSFTLNVNNATQHFKVGQSVELKLTQHANKWQVDISSSEPKGTQNNITAQINAKQTSLVLASTLPKQTPLPLQIADKAAHFNIQKSLPVSVQSQFGPQPTTPPTLIIDKQQQIKLQWTQTDSSIGKIPIEGNFKGKIIELAGTSQTAPVTSKGETVRNDKLPTQGPIIKNSEAAAIHKANQVSHTSAAEINSEGGRQRIQLTSPEAHKLTSEIQPILRSLQARIESPSTLINRVELAISSLKLDANSPVDKIVEQLAKSLEITQDTKIKNDVTAQEIKQIFNTATLPVTPNSVTSPLQNQSQLLTGLMGMMQVSLAARLANKGNAQLEKITQLFTPIAANTARPTSKQQVGKSLNEFLQADSKFQLLKGIDKLLSSHQYNKLSSLEVQLQGQDSMYYVLPFGGNEKRNDVEVLIKKEQEKQHENEKDKKQGTCWALTMKLPVGEIGQVLAKAKINGKNLDLDFYTSTPETRDLVFNFIPILKKRFDTLGIDIDKCHCQLGKIPESLQERPYQLFEAKA